jgi:hypothetical protein
LGSENTSAIALQTIQTNVESARVIVRVSNWVLVGVSSVAQKVKHVGVGCLFGRFQILAGTIRFGSSDCLLRSWFSCWLGSWLLLGSLKVFVRNRAEVDRVRLVVKLVFIAIWYDKVVLVIRYSSLLGGSARFLLDCSRDELLELLSE